MTTAPSSPEVNRGVRQRTRRAILDAAVSGWARDGTLSLGDIADRAAVSRSTLHRYYADRQSLIEAARDHAIAELEAAGDQAVGDAGSAAEELSGLLRACVRHGDGVLFLYGDPHRFPELLVDGTADKETLEIIERAQREGVVAADLDPKWVLSMFYAVAYTTAEVVASGSLSPGKAGDLAVRTLLRGVGGTEE